MDALTRLYFERVERRINDLESFVIEFIQSFHHEEQSELLRRMKEKKKADGCDG